MGQFAPKWVGQLYPKQVGQFTPKYTSKVRSWFKQNLSKADFRSALTEKRKGTETSWTQRPLEFRLSKLFQNFDYDMPEPIMLDMLSFDIHGIHTLSHPNKQTSLTAKVLEECNLDSVKERVLANLNEGITSVMVTRNHISLCENLELVEAKSALKSLIEMKDFLDDNDKIEAFDTYIYLGGIIEDFIFIFNDFDNVSEFAWYVLREFSKYERYFNRIKRFILTNIGSGVVRQDSISVMQILIDVGSEDGLKFFVESIKQSKVAPDFHTPSFGVDHLSAQFVADIMIDLLEYMIVNEMKADRISEPLYLPLSYLSRIAFREEPVYQNILAQINRIADEHRDMQVTLRSFLHRLEKEYYLQKLDYNSIRDASVLTPFGEPVLPGL